MFFWNKVELYSGSSLKEFSDLRNALAIQGMHYDYKIVQTDASRNVRKGYISTKTNPNVMYYLYIHHKDYDKAMFHTSNRDF